MDKPSQRGRPRKPRPPGLSGELGEAIEQRRKELGWTADELGARAGLGLGTVIRVERADGSATLDTVAALAGALGVSAADLLARCPTWTGAPAAHGPAEVRALPRTVAVVDPEMAAERLAIAWEMWRSTRSMLANLLRSEHPDWTDEQINGEIARRFAGESS